MYQEPLMKFASEAAATLNRRNERELRYARLLSIAARLQMLACRPNPPRSHRQLLTPCGER
jgi:hypothetical protein